MIITLQLSMSIATMEEEIVCQCKIKPGHETVIAKTSSCIALNFQRPGQLLEDWIIVCWLDMAVDWYQ